MAKNTEISPEQAKYNVGDQVAFTLEKQKFAGIIEKGYTNSFLISFNSDDPAIVDKYHNKVVINNKKLKMIKAAPKKPASKEDE
ncbi:DUF2187 domain-containing protein [Nicoliella lavandulae]|uniref:DUF2187 domain-containing protein n=1 Tax=Nicoliella lavandulae TaxID=3082954 RepID=A0ABU8SI81_9LACO